MRVLVTRAEEDGRRTASRLEERGHAAILAPVLRIVATGAAPPPEPWDALVLTSSHAVPHLAGLPRTIPLFAVGPRTAGAAREAGFADLREAGGDAQQLVPLVLSSLPPPATLLQATAPDRKAEPGASLRAHGFRVLVWECYAAEAVERLPDPACAALRSRHLDAALHFSRRSAELLAGLADREGLVPALCSVPHLCLSADVSAPLSALGAETSVAPEPNEDGLMALLDGFAR